MSEPAEHDPAAVQSQLAQIWRDALSREAVAADDHFFDLGGDSLAATLIAAGAEEVFAVEIGPGDVYANPTLEYFTRTVLEKLAEKAAR